MNGNQITISVNSDDFNELRKIARTRGQTVSDYISCLVSSNLVKSNATAGPNTKPTAAPIAEAPEIRHQEPVVMNPARARAR
jgi:hypothetical protein